MTTTLRNRGRLGQGFSFSAGKRSLSSASQTDDDFFFAKTFFLLQSFYGIQIPPYFDDDGGVIDYGECIVLYDLDYSSRSFCFVLFFFLKLVKVNNNLEQLLTCIYYKLRLLKRIQCCCNVLPYLSSLRAPHNHIMFQSPLEIVAFTSG